MGFLSSAFGGKKKKVSNGTVDGGGQKHRKSKDALAEAMEAAIVASSKIKIGNSRGGKKNKQKSILSVSNNTTKTASIRSNTINHQSSDSSMSLSSCYTSGKVLLDNNASNENQQHLSNSSPALNLLESDEQNDDQSDDGGFVEDLFLYGETESQKPSKSSLLISTLSKNSALSTSTTKKKRKKKKKSSPSSLKTLPSSNSRRQTCHDWDQPGSSHDNEGAVGAEDLAADVPNLIEEPQRTESMNSVESLFVDDMTMEPQADYFNFMDPDYVPPTGKISNRGSRSSDEDDGNQKGNGHVASNTHSSLMFEDFIENEYDENIIRKGIDDIQNPFDNHKVAGQKKQTKKKKKKHQRKEQEHEQIPANHPENSASSVASAKSSLVVDDCDNNKEIIFSVPDHENVNQLRNSSNNQCNDITNETTTAAKAQLQVVAVQEPIENMSNSFTKSSPGSSTNYQSDFTRDLVKTFIGKIWNLGQVDWIPLVCTPSLRFNNHNGLERVGLENFKSMVLTVRNTIEEYCCTIHSMVVEDNKCFVRLSFSGRHVGELLGYQPSNQLVRWQGASEFTICPKRRQIVKVWEISDFHTLEKQLKGGC